VLYKYVLHERSREDYETSLKWYTERSRMAAENFITAVDDALQLIGAHPAKWRNTYKNYHELGLKNTLLLSSTALKQIAG
jgi:hypothetical protein